VPRVNNAVNFGMSLCVAENRLKQAGARSKRTLIVSVEFFELYFVIRTGVFRDAAPRLRFS